MRFNSPRVASWYSLVCGISTAALLFAYQGVMAALLGFILAASVSTLILIAVRRADESDSPYLQLSEQIGIVGLVVCVMMMPFMGLLPALLVFIGFAQTALLLQTHDYRRFYFGILVSFAALMAGAVETRSGLYLIFFLAYAVAIGITLGYAHIEPRSGNRSDWRPFDQLRASLWLVGVAVMIYLVMPRFPAGNLGGYPGSEHFYENAQWESEASEYSETSVEDGPADTLMRELARGVGGGGNAAHDPEPGSGRGGYQYAGFDQEMDINNPDARGQRFSNAIVARMRADTPLYLRARIFDRFDGLRWSSSAQALSKLKLHYGETRLAGHNTPSDAAIQRYEIFVEEDLGDYIPAAAVPVKIAFPATVLGIDAFGQLHAPGALRGGSAYVVESQRSVIQGRTFAELGYTELASFRQLPRDLDPRIEALARRVTANSPTQLQKAIALERHLRSQYAYDFGSIFSSQNQTPLSQFLFETRKGHCEYFASALAVMLRSLGIPARLVTGFSATDQNPLTGYYDIHALDGHAWVEAYVDGLGWVELEPTAYYEGPMAETRTLSAEQIDAYVERQLRLRQALGSDEINLELIMGSLWQSLRLGVIWLGAYLKLLLLNTWQLLAMSAISLLAAYLLWLCLAPHWRAWRIRKRLELVCRRTPEHALTHYLDAIDRLLRNAGHKRPPGLTIEQYLQALAVLQIRFDQRTLSELFNRIHYSSDRAGFDPSGYRELFEHLYRLGPARLKDLVSTRFSPVGAKRDFNSETN